MRLMEIWHALAAITVIPNTPNVAVAVLPEAFARQFPSSARGNSTWYTDATVSLILIRNLITLAKLGKANRGESPGKELVPPSFALTFIVVVG